MHLALFFLVNLVVAGAMGGMAYANGVGAGGIALRVIATLVALQAAYAIWLFVVALLDPAAKADSARTEPRSERMPRPRKITARTRDNAP